MTARNLIGYRRGGAPIYLCAGGAPTPQEIIEARLAELRTQFTAAAEARGALLDAAAGEKRGLTDEEKVSHADFGATMTTLREQEKPLEERLTEIADLERRQGLDNAARANSGIPEGGAQVTEPAIYRRGDINGPSFFRDISEVRFKDTAFEAKDRLQRHSLAMAAEQRALGNTGATGGSGGEFAPPKWMVEDYIKLARPGRVTADLFKHLDVPAGVSSVDYPKIATGTTVAPQTTQNSALSQTDLTTTFVSTGFTSIGGKQVVSQQLLDQSAINFDDVITGDLIMAHAQQVGAQVLNGAGVGASNAGVVNGLNNTTVANTLAVTAQTALNFYSKSLGLLAGFAATRFLPATCWLMHPRRWFWLMNQTDTTNRPLVVPTAVAYNPIAQTDNPAAVAGNVGTFLGLPVYMDPNMGVTFGAANNEDRVYLLKQDDLLLFESPFRIEMFREPYADSMGILYRVYSYLGTILNRQAASIGVLTGLTPPAF